MQVAAVRRAGAREMARIPSSTFWMGSDHHYPEEAPARQVSVDAFEIDVTPVTNDAFAA